MQKTGASTQLLVGLRHTITAWVEVCHLSPMEGGKMTKREEKEATRADPRVRYLGPVARTGTAPTGRLCEVLQPLAKKREKSGKKATAAPSHEIWLTFVSAWGYKSDFDLLHGPHGKAKGLNGKKVKMNSQTHWRTRSRISCAFANAFANFC